MKEFMTGHLVPAMGVVFAIVALTLALFDVPARPTQPIFGLRVAPSAEHVTHTSAERARVDDTLTRVLRTLDEGRRPPPATSLPATAVASAPRIAGTNAGVLTPVSAAQPANPNAAQPASADPKLLNAVSALSDAVRAIHDARSEEDLVRAEDLVRNARVQMETNCATSTGPLCASADQIRALGY